MKALTAFIQLVDDTIWEREEELHIFLEIVEDHPLGCAKVGRGKIIIRIRQDLNDSK